MRVKRTKKKIYGAEFSTNEKRAMNLEIQRQFAEYDLKNEKEIDAMVLWLLHTEYGFGPKRLKQFYKRFRKAMKELVDRYHMDDEDTVWLCTFKLKEYGIDIDEWAKESEEE